MREFIGGLHADAVRAACASRVPGARRPAAAAQRLRTKSTRGARSVADRPGAVFSPIRFVYPKENDMTSSTKKLMIRALTIASMAVSGAVFAQAGGGGAGGGAGMGGSAGVGAGGGTAGGSGGVGAGGTGSTGGTGGTGAANSGYGSPGVTGTGGGMGTGTGATPNAAPRHGYGRSSGGATMGTPRTAPPSSTQYNSEGSGR